MLSEDAGVIAVSMRGHGLSAGRSTLGDLEVLDVDAALQWASALGYGRLVSLGFSMGASAVIRHAALRGAPDAVVAVSGPSRWYYRGTPSMRRLHRLVDGSAGRAAVRIARRTRVSPRPWAIPFPIEPRVAAREMSAPLLVVHGDRDSYFPLDHAYQLHEAGPHVELWIEEGFAHAENAMSDDLVRRIAHWSMAVRNSSSTQSRP